MKRNNNSINSELSKLEYALQKVLLTIRKQLYDREVFLLLFLSIVLLKDGLLKAFRYIIVHTSEGHERTNMFQTLTTSRGSYYVKILDKIQSIGISQLHVILIYNHFQNIDHRKIKNEEYIQVFEDLIVELFQIGSKADSNSLLPKEIIDTIFLLDNRTDKSLYNPYSGFGDLSFHSSIKNYYGEEENIYYNILHLLRVLIHDKEDKIIVGNKITIPKQGNQENKFDLVFSMPPINRILRKSSRDKLFSNDNNLNYYENDTHEQAFFKNAFQWLKPDGNVIVIIAQSFLKEMGTSKRFVKDWVNNHRLQTIIALPNLKHQFQTSIQLYIVFLSNKTNLSGQVKYIDARKFLIDDGFKRKKLDIDYFKEIIYQNADSSVLKFVKQETIVENNYNLCVNGYFLTQYEGIELRNICTEIRGTKRGATEQFGRLIKIGDLKSDKHDFFLSISELELIEVKGFKEITESCLLLSLLGGKLKPTYFIYSGVSIYISPNIIALRIDSQNVDIGYLVNELNQSYVSDQLINLSSGTVIPFIKKEMLLGIVVDINKTIKEQKRIVEKIDSSTESDINALNLAKIEIDKLRKEFIDDVRSKEHNILQFLSASQSAALIIDHIISKEENISINNREVIIRQINSLRKSLSSASYNIRRLSKRMNFDEKEDCDVNLLIIEAIAQGINNSSQFIIDYNFDRDSFYIPIEKGVETVYIDPISFISKNDFFILYNNILENAIKHGFKNENRKYKFKVELFCMRENEFSDSLTIIFSNNGIPLPKGMAEAYSIRGEKAGDTANEGIGSWQVYQIVKEHFKGDIKIIDSPSEEFPVKIEIKLPIVGWTEIK